MTGQHVDGGYAEYMLSNAAHTYHVPDELDLVEAAPLFWAQKWVRPWERKRRQQELTEACPPLHAVRGRHGPGGGVAVCKAPSCRRPRWLPGPRRRGVVSLGPVYAGTVPAKRVCAECLRTVGSDEAVDVVLVVVGDRHIRDVPARVTRNGDGCALEYIAPSNA
ncbi:hypothetical protein [Streptomyces sp. NPDC056690]|uniref:hypothetical protein n=1 Tax=unclassified Streptomyces TaxID=2593676 RepID=UPI00363F88AF